MALRAWRGSEICDAEPRFLLDELTAVNSALGRYLDRARGDAPQDWPERRIALADELGEGLSSVADLHQQNLGALAGCGFAASAGFPFVRQRGLALIEAARARAARLPAVIAEARRARAREAWAKSLPSLREAARAGCRARSAAPRVFFAWADDQGTHWCFCDGARVSLADDRQEPELEPPLREPARGRHPFTQQQYLDAVRDFPHSSVAAAPEQG
ncbi:MAG: hypothetical protein IPJ65_04565 [Archangiaceae bacterium]|nr:hypothetical protein [Archangiaceae bacterium]